MDLFKLLASMLKRLITAISSPFRMLIVQLQRLLNINVISAKLIQPLTKNVKKLFHLRPSEKADYVKLGPFLVFKQLLKLLVLAACAGVFIYFSMFAGQIQATPASLMEIKTDTTFSYDDISIKEFTGIANIKSFDGVIIYTGEIDRGVCKGNGFLYSRDGKLIYEGGFDDNRYNGYGISYSPDGKVAYEGEFAGNLYHGTGTLYNAKEAILYSGGFVNGEFEGTGKLYNDGMLLYEGAFAAGKSHGTGAQYYPNGTLHYKGDFFEGAFQGRGELYDEAGRLLYTGAMHGGKINYHSLVGANLAEIESAFNETPGIYYYEDGNSCFFYEKAGVVITTDCRVKVYEWEREKENPSDGFYYVPGGSGEETQPDTGLRDEDIPDTDEAADEDIEYEVWDTAYVSPAAQKLSPVPMAWVVIDPYASDDSSDSSSSSSSSSSSASSARQSSSASSEDVTLRENSGTGNSEASKSGNGNGMPDFVEKTKHLYFEIDKDVWQPEEDLDKTKVFIKRVTVIGSAPLPDGGATPVEDNGPPGVEDCVAIDNIRKQMPTAFADVAFEMDKQNKLFLRIWNINYANMINRKTFVAGDVTYRFCYQQDGGSVPAYYSIES